MNDRTLLNDFLIERGWKWDSGESFGSLLDELRVDSPDLLYRLVNESSLDMLQSTYLDLVFLNSLQARIDAGTIDQYVGQLLDLGVLKSESAQITLMSLGVSRPARPVILDAVDGSTSLCIRSHQIADHLTIDATTTSSQVNLDIINIIREGTKGMEYEYLYDANIAVNLEVLLNNLEEYVTYTVDYAPW